MPSDPAPSAARRAPLTRERVLRAAIALADQSGIESLTMRRLGQELGVEAMSLYNHVANKDDILDGIVDLVLSDIDVPADGDRLEDAHASAGDLGPRGPAGSPVGGDARSCRGSTSARV